MVWILYDNAYLNVCVTLKFRIILREALLEIYIAQNGRADIFICGWYCEAPQFLGHSLGWSFSSAITVSITKSGRLIPS